MPSPIPPMRPALHRRNTPRLSGVPAGESWNYMLDWVFDPEEFLRDEATLRSPTCSWTSCYAHPRAQSKTSLAPRRAACSDFHCARESDRVRQRSWQESDSPFAAASECAIYVLCTVFNKAS